MSPNVFIYYPLRDRLAADFLRDLIIQEFSTSSVGELTDKLVSNHPLPVFEIYIPTNELEKFLSWIPNHRGEFSVKIELHDKTQWLGRQL